MTEPWVGGVGHDGLGGSVLWGIIAWLGGFVKVWGRKAWIFCPDLLGDGRNRHSLAALSHPDLTAEAPFRKKDTDGRCLFAD